MFQLDGKTVVITGAGGGIGRPLVKTFLDAGARVVACDRSPELIADLDVAHKAYFELTDRASIAAAAADILDTVGVPDVLVSNAGFTRGEYFEKVTDALWYQDIEVNLNGVRHFADPIITAMIANGGGTQVFIASVNGFAHFGHPAYSVAKAGLLAYMKAIATEHGRRGIRANAVCPGSVRTDAWNYRIAGEPDLIDRASRYYALQRLVTPQEVANAALFLASPLSSGITGAELPVDAGLTAGNVRFVDDIVRAAVLKD
ncbi:SDR family oxidoreductase [Ensifer soli]|uniref:SDR family oxidoreductase n=1 Tax=Ciceribacter sp. sgz301302 TaxID=3342379 RepID=UPI0035BB24CA